MGGVFPSDTTIYIGTVDTIGASLCVSSNAIVGEIEKFSITGGEQDVESVPVIGGFVDKETPRSQFEVSFNVIVNNTAASTFDRWDALKFGGSASEYTSAVEASKKAITIVMSKDGGTPWKFYAFNNCRAVTWEPEMSSDDMLRGTITFKFSPTTALGVPNLKTSTCTTSTAFPTTWSS